MPSSRVAWPAILTKAAHTWMAQQRGQDRQHRRTGFDRRTPHPTVTRGGPQAEEDSIIRRLCSQAPVCQTHPAAQWDTTQWECLRASSSCETQLQCIGTGRQAALGGISVQKSVWTVPPAPPKALARTAGKSRNLTHRGEGGT